MKKVFESFIDTINESHFEMRPNPSFEAVLNSAGFREASTFNTNTPHIIPGAWVYKGDSGEAIVAHDGNGTYVQYMIYLDILSDDVVKKLKDRLIVPPFVTWNKDSKIAKAVNSIKTLDQKITVWAKNVNNTTFIGDIDDEDRDKDTIRSLQREIDNIISSFKPDVIRRSSSL